MAGAATLDGQNKLRIMIKKIKAKIARKERKNICARIQRIICKMAMESDNTIAQTARNLGVKSTTLHTWISKYWTMLFSIYNLTRNKFFK